MFRRIGRVKVVPVEPETKSTVSKQAKSECELPYGPSISAKWLATVEEDDWLAFLKRREVKPLCDLRRKTRSPLWESGTEAIVAG